MPLVSRNEIKNILRITDNYTENEAVTFSSMSPKKLTNKGNVNIIYVAADADNSTVHTTFYSTSADYKTTKDIAGYTLIKRFSTSTTIGDTQTVYVRYTNNEYDTQIDDLIPQITNDLIEYLNNTFEDENTEYYVANAQFVSSNRQIKDTLGQFLLRGFQSGMDIVVEGSYRNSGLYNISSVTSQVMTLSNKDTILNERSTDYYGGNNIHISRVKWPVGLKKSVAKIIWINLDKPKGDNLKSKSIGPLSITYNSLNSGGYSDDIYNELKKYKKVKTM